MLHEALQNDYIIEGVKSRKSGFQSESARLFQDN